MSNYSFINFLLSLSKLSTTPRTIIYPYPLLALMAFSLSGVFNVILLIKATLISFIFYAGINLWNHVNDIKEDTLAGKKTIIIENSERRKTAVAAPIILYCTSFLLTFFWIGTKFGILAFLGAAFSTWIYSDRLAIGRKFRRWKDHYATEILAYIIFAPSFTLLIWMVFAPVSITGIAFSIFITFFLLAGTFLKDIKDISCDRIAGLNTLGVVFPTETLLKSSFLLFTFYYLSILLFSLFGWLPLLCIFSVVASIGLIYTVRHFLLNDWRITAKEVKPLMLMTRSNILSITILIIMGFTQIL